MSDVNEIEKKIFADNWFLLLLFYFLLVWFIYIRVQCETNNKRERPYVKITSNDTSSEQLAARALCLIWCELSTTGAACGIVSLRHYTLWPTNLCHDMDMEVTWVRVRVRYSYANYSKHITGLKMMDYCLSSYVQEFSVYKIGKYFSFMSFRSSR